MQGDHSVHTEDTQMTMTMVSLWREPQLQGDGGDGRKGSSEHSGWSRT